MLLEREIGENSKASLDVGFLEAHSEAHSGHTVGVQYPLPRCAARLAVFGFHGRSNIFIAHDRAFVREDAERFLHECFRVLKTGGIIRLVTPTRIPRLSLFGARNGKPRIYPRRC